MSTGKPSPAPRTRDQLMSILFGCALQCTEPLSSPSDGGAGEIARIALKRGYIKVQGRTPEATMASAM